MVRPHRAGYGDSRDLSGALTLADHARHLAELLDDRDIPRAHVVGHSSGGSVALHLAAARPERVASLVLLEPAAPFAPDEPDGDTLGDAIAAARGGDPDRAFDLFLGSACGPGFRAVLRRGLGEDGLDACVRSAPYFFEREIGALAGWDADAAGIDGIDRPVLLVEGAEGERLGTPYRARNRALAARLARAERLVLPGVSHAMPLEDPSLVARTVLDFVGRYPR